MKQTKRTLVSLLLVFAMLATCLVAFSVTASAANPVEDTNKDGTLPEGAVVKTGTAENFSGGDGTAANPYQIKDVTEWRYFQSLVNSSETSATYLAANYVLTGNIYYNDKFASYSETSMPDNTTYSSANLFSTSNLVCGIQGEFSGTLDGAGYGIYNLYRRFANGGALFEKVSGTIKNLNLYGGYIYYGGNGNSGSLVGTLSAGTVENCYSSVSFYSKSGTTGGLIGYAGEDVTIKDCTYAGFMTVTATTSAKAAGIVAQLANNNVTVEVSGCVNAGVINSAAERTAGIVGLYIGAANGYNFYQAGALTFKNCKNTGSITSTNTSASAVVAGILGRAGTGDNTAIGSITFDSCENAGALTGASAVGGIMGGTHNSVTNGAVMNKCVNRGAIKSTGDYAGGLAGKYQQKSSTAKFTDCANYGTVTGVNYVGGFVGGNDSNQYAGLVSSFYNCGSYGDVTGTTEVGGLMGRYNRTSNYNQMPVEGTVIACTVKGETKVGGLVGHVELEDTAKQFSVKLNASAVLTKVVATAADGAYGIIAGDTNSTAADVLTMATTNIRALYTATVNGAAVETPVPVTGTTTATLACNTLAEVTDGTMLGYLNAYATAGGYCPWISTAAPQYFKFVPNVLPAGATLSLRDTMTLKLFVKASAVSDITDLATITVNDGTKDYAGALDAETNSYVFEITGLAAKDMGTTKTYTVKYTLASDTANPIVCNGGVEYSPLQYAINMYNKNNGADANFAALLTSMVRYMDAAGATDAKSTFSTATEYTFDDTAVDAAYAAIVAKDAESTFDFPEGTAELGAELTSGIILLVNPATGMTLTSVKIGETELTIESAGENIWRVNGLNPGDLYNELTFTFTTAEGTVTGTYSIARYLNSYVGTASETLAKATALYMDAFITYKTLG